MGTNTHPDRDGTMQEITRKRILRKLESLPDNQLYQVLDFIEFLEAKYAAAQAHAPSGIERFAERVEDRMRTRSLAAGVMTSTMRLLGAATRVVEGTRAVGRDIIGEARNQTPPPPVTGDGEGAIGQR
jgi:hypothetical protein